MENSSASMNGIFEGNARSANPLLCVFARDKKTRDPLVQHITSATSEFFNQFVRVVT